MVTNEALFTISMVVFFFFGFFSGKLTRKIYPKYKFIRFLKFINICFLPIIKYIVKGMWALAFTFFAFQTGLEEALFEISKIVYYMFFGGIWFWVFYEVIESAIDTYIRLKTNNR